MTATLDRTRPLTIASRGSALALAQTRQIGARLSGALGIEIAVLEVLSHGDADPRALTTIGGTGVFVSALREALRERTADVAVHSFKDLPTAGEPDLVIAAVPSREDPADVLVSAGSVALQELPAGARVGTGSPRRAAQIAALRPDLEVVAVRGNVDTRIAKVREGVLDAVVLARAGLARLGRLDDVSQQFSPAQMLPAPAQGALAIECRASDIELAQLLRDALDDATTRSCVEAERAVLEGLEAGCSAPVGALATYTGDVLSLTACVGGELRYAETSPAGEPDAARALGMRVAAELVRRGARTQMTATQPASAGFDTSDTGRGWSGNSMETD
jgi:hydroxymethylbilane synthase